MTVQKNPPALFRVRVHLVDSNPEIWRLIEIDAGLRLHNVHQALQILFGWENSHLHVFEDLHPDAICHPGVPVPRRWGGAFLREEDEDLLVEEASTLQDVLAQDRPLYYTYDLGDRWLHQLSLIETLPLSPGDNAVTVIRGQGRGPVEDSGGIGGYEELLEILAEPSHELYEETAEWVAELTGAPLSAFDPAAFDKTATNRALRQQFRRWAGLRLV